MQTAYDFSFETLQGKPYPLKDLTGRPLVIVNTASKCGFTPQYKGLEALWRDHKDSGLMVIGVPCNDFGGQEPGSADEISSFCELNYGVDFPMMAKVHVKGPAAHPFFKWVSGQGGFMTSPKWNFFKYLIGKDGQLTDWFSSITAPDSTKFQAAISKLLAQ
ncbi:MAG: glutathione peroxidase [Acidocella sp. 20-57-95]|nr:MAG: glutathione peroxidase [Acidocella sp. 20-57-95]OYV61734.1 MAG: glutathione peroxidase [Acidocella sp. 21-58-7]HQT65199.1 glutathione peroxidase [Acidocella sp.]